MAFSMAPEKDPDICLYHMTYSVYKGGRGLFTLIVVEVLVQELLALLLWGL